jgi:hypothetical protein
MESLLGMGHKSKVLNLFVVPVGIPIEGQDKYMEKENISELTLEFLRDMQEIVINLFFVI